MTLTLFETYVIKVLEKYLLNQSKRFTAVDHINVHSNIIDAILPDGIDNIMGPTGVVIKFTKQEINSYFASIRRTCERLDNKEEYKSIIFIIAIDLPIDKREDLKKVATKITGMEVHIWGIEELLTITNSSSESISEIMLNLEKDLINNIVTKSLEKGHGLWKQRRTEYIKQLTQSFKKDDLVLFLGAGVSQDAGIPRWNTLVSDLLVAMISDKLSDNNIDISETEQNLILEQLKDLIDGSPLLQARYIRIGLGDKFVDVVSKVLYKMIRNGVNGSSDILKSITRLCLPRRNSNGIKAVVTYNFDDLVEKNLENSDIEHIPVYREIDVPSKDELPIYHVHGFLPRNTKEYSGLTESLLVFSEEGYHALQLDPYSWSNITQLNFFRENTCLLVGLSLTDPNLRRLLEIAARKTGEPRHYAILKRHEYTKHIKTKEGIRVDVVKAFSKVDQELREKSFAELGLNIIWIDEYSEIPNLLDSIRN